MPRARDEVVLYVKPGCDECARARALLRSRQIEWREVDISAAGMLPRREMFVQGSNWHVPLLAGAGLVQVGYDEPAFHRIVDAVNAQRRANSEPRMADGG